MVNLIVIGIGGFFGAIARYGLTSLLQKDTSSSFPFGTLAANVLGCFLMGILAYLVQERELFPPATRGFLLIGLLGAMTTFSTFSIETVRLLQGGKWMFAFGNILGSVLLCLGALILGRFLIKSIVP